MISTFSIKKTKFRFSNINDGVKKKKKNKNISQVFLSQLETIYKYVATDFTEVRYSSGTKCHGLTSIYDYWKRKRDRKRERAEISKTFPLIEQDNLSGSC